MNIIENLNWRYAVKKFNGNKVDDETIETLKEAIRLSPSSYGLQPYRVFIISSEEMKKELLPYSYGQEKILKCSHLFVFAASTHSPENIIEHYIDAYAQTNAISQNMLSNTSIQLKEALAPMNDSELEMWAHQQAFIALGNFLTCATSLKVDSCPMGGFEADGYDKVLNLKDKNLTTTVICPIGYRHQDDRNAYKPKVRLDKNLLFKEL